MAYSFSSHFCIIFFFSCVLLIPQSCLTFLIPSLLNGNASHRGPHLRPTRSGFPALGRAENKLHSCCPRLSRKTISWRTHLCSQNTSHPVEQPHSRVPGGKLPPGDGKSVQFCAPTSTSHSGPYRDFHAWPSLVPKTRAERMAFAETLTLHTQTHTRKILELPYRRFLLPDRMRRGKEKKVEEKDDLSSSNTKATKSQETSV